MSLEDMQTAMADLHIYMEDMEGREITDLKEELKLNIVPLLQGFMTSSISNAEEQWGAIQELIETTEDVIHPELAGLIIGTLEVGGAICQLIKHEVQIENDLVRKKIEKLMLEYQRSAVLAIQRVAEVTIDEDEEEDADGNDSSQPENSSTPQTQEASQEVSEAATPTGGDGTGTFVGEFGDGGQEYPDEFGDGA